MQKGSGIGQVLESLERFSEDRKTWIQHFLKWTLWTCEVVNVFAWHILEFCDGFQALSGSTDGSVKLWCLKAFRCTGITNTHVAVVPSGKMFFFFSEQLFSKSLRAWVVSCQLEKMVCIERWIVFPWSGLQRGLTLHDRFMFFSDPGW